MPAKARDIRARLRQQEADELQKREDAVVAVGEAAAAAVRARADNDAALRAAFEAALKTREDGARATTLRTAFEAALADSPRVVEAELVAGRAVLAAAAFKVAQPALAEFTELRVEDLRRWAQMARQADAAPDVKSTNGDRGGRRDQRESAVKPATGYAVVGAASQGEDGDHVSGDAGDAGDGGEGGAAAAAG